MSNTGVSCKTIKSPSVSDGYSSFSKHFIPLSTEEFSNEYGIWANNIWTDGTNIYLSSDYDHFVWNKEKMKWEEKKWNVPKWSGCDVWSDGANIYYSSYEYGYYKLNTETGEWEEKTWNGIENIDGFFAYHIWTDGTNIYYSDCADPTSDTIKTIQYVLNRETETWEVKTWNGFARVDASNIWTDGTNIYFSSGTAQYVLNGDTWEEKTWSNLTSFSGSNVFEIGGGIYCSGGTSTYKCEGDWYQVTNFDIGTDNYIESGRNIWSDGTNVYYTYEGQLAILLPFSARKYQKVKDEWIEKIDSYTATSLTVTPTEETQVFKPTLNGDKFYSEVTVEPIPDGYIKPSGSLTITANGTTDVTEKASVAVNVQPKTQTKSTTITSNGTTTISKDSAYDGMTSVSITTNVQPNLQELSEQITENGQYNFEVDSGYDGFDGRIEIDVNVPTAPTPTEISTESEMTSALSSAEIGTLYKYTGTSGTYEQNAIYIVEEV